MSKAAIAKAFSQDEEDNAVLFEGVLHKVGQRYKTWKRRTMILRKDNIIYYYKDVGKNHLGVIPLTDEKCKMREGVLSDCSWPRNTAMPTTIVIETKLRTFYTYAETLGDALQWREAISKRLQALSKANSSPSTPGQSRALKSKVKKDKFYRQATKRYQEENGRGESDDDDDDEDDEDEDDSFGEDGDINGDQNGQEEVGSPGDSVEDESHAFVKGTDRKEKKRIITRDNTLLSDQSD
jgi:hypothetical protein